LILTPEWIEEVRRELPELPGPRRQRFVEQYGLSFEDATTLTATRAMADYYEAVVAQGVEARAAANWILSELMYLLRSAGADISACPIAPPHLAGLIKLIDEGTISGKIAKTVIQEMFQTGKTAEEVVKEKGLVQLSDPAQLEPIIDEILGAHPDKVSAYRGGKVGLLGFFVGQVMKATQGKANPQLVNQLLREKLASSSE
ncbi:MAG: Asp-tRNA(Asn)/Glu-tRNA(Gln) amidotransferase GatCAB subunit B, partial [Acidobacteria bacterium]